MRRTWSYGLVVDDGLSELVWIESSEDEFVELRGINCLMRVITPLSASIKLSTEVSSNSISWLKMLVSSGN